jgi:sugar O-acyltransferase (sialic acid O-acetyltransferase NeuD family)
MKCVIVGADTPFLSDALAILHRLDWEVEGFVAGGDDVVEHAPGIRPVDAGRVPAAWPFQPAVIPILTPWQCKAVLEQARALGFDRFPPVVDPTTVAAHDVTLGEGCMINAGVVIGAKTRVGAFSTLNRCASVGHDGTIGPFCFVGPGATLCGRITVGEGSIIGAGAVILPKVTIGPGSLVAAGSLVKRDVPPASLVAGQPARVVKSGLTARDVTL